MMTTLGSKQSFLIQWFFAFSIISIVFGFPMLDLNRDPSPEPTEAVREWEQVRTSPREAIHHHTTDFIPSHIVESMHSHNPIFPSPITLPVMTVSALPKKKYKRKPATEEQKKKKIENNKKRYDLLRSFQKSDNPIRKQVALQHFKGIYENKMKYMKGFRERKRTGNLTKADEIAIEKDKLRQKRYRRNKKQKEMEIKENSSPSLKPLK